MRRFLSRIAIWWLGGPKWVDGIVIQGGVVQAAGQQHGLNPAIREFFVDGIVAGRDAEDAACAAMEACAMTDVIASRRGRPE